MKVYTVTVKRVVRTKTYAVVADSVAQARHQALDKAGRDPDMNPRKLYEVVRVKT